jgi:ElaB/YqjD/DUF883 family membrane-anchored ribosome-binding protein
VLSARPTARRHLSETELLTARQEGERPAHLDECHACRARFAELEAFLEAVRNDAVDAADEVFAPERLEAQATHVRRRLENLSRPVRVLTFPAPRRGAPMVERAGRRWVAMAAAAGLLIGLAAGFAVSVRPFGSGVQPRAALQRAAGNSKASPARTAALPNVRTAADRRQGDEAFLSEADSAFGSPHVEELQAIDAMTPRVREIAALSR